MRLRHFPAWLIGSKVRLGLLLGYCAVLAVAAVVDPPWPSREPAGSRSRGSAYDPSASRSREAASDPSWVRLRAAAVADSLFGSSEGSWSIVAEIDTPQGKSIRIRPNVDQIEIRGCDLVVQEVITPGAGVTSNGFLYPPDSPHLETDSPTDKNRPAPGSPVDRPGETDSPTTDPVRSKSANVWPTSRSTTKERASDQPSSRSSGSSLSHAEDGLTWRCRPLSAADRERVARSASVIGLAGTSFAGVELTAPRRIARRDRAGDWEFWLEGMLDPGPQSRPAGPHATESSWRALPWSTAVPPHDIAIPVKLRIDPENGALLEIRDARFTVESVGQALLFDPNPVATSGILDLRDGNAVDGYRKWVSLPRLNGNGKLQGRWVVTRSDRPPIADEPALVFAYPSYDPRFEEAMAYHHVDRGIERVHERGFDGLFTSPIIARVHGTAADNSWYSRPTRELVFGDGGVDDAEDADIILHELGHAIHDALVPGFDEGDTRAISEGFADFWAASMTGEPCIGDWDATSYSPPCLRSAENGAAYPISLTGRAHADGQIWSGVLWDVRTALGEEAAERIALAAFLEQDASTTWPEAAESLVRAASRSGSSEEVARVVDALVRRGLIARELSIQLEPGSEWSLRFLSPVKFLAHSVGSLYLTGDGTIGFAPPGSPFLESAPRVVAAGLGEVENAPLGLVLDCAVRIDGELVTVQQTWRVSTTELVAVRIEWDTVGGALSWTYERANEGTEALAPFAEAASVPQSDPVAIDWEKLTGDVGGIVSCRGSLESLRGMIGARFTMTPESATDPYRSFRLARTGQPRPPGDGPLLVAFPNPGRGGTALRLFLDRSSPADVALFDAQGRIVRKLSSPGMLPSGLSEWRWDGRDDRGHPLPAGRYWARASMLTGTARIPVVLIR